MLLELYVKTNEPSLVVAKYVHSILSRLNGAGHKIRVQQVKHIDTAAAAMLKRKGISSLPTMLAGTNVIAGSRSIIAQLSRMMGGAGAGGGQGAANAPRAARMRQNDSCDDWMMGEMMSGVKRNNKKLEIDEDESNINDDDHIDMKDITKRMSERLQGRGPPAPSRIDNRDDSKGRGGARGDGGNRREEPPLRQQYTRDEYDEEEEDVRSGMANEELHSTMLDQLMME